MSEQELRDENEELQKVRKQHADLKRLVHREIENLVQTLKKEITPGLAKALEDGRQLQKGQKGDMGDIKEGMQFAEKRFASWMLEYVKLEKRFFGYSDMLVVIGDVEALLRMNITQKQVFAGLKEAMAPYIDVEAAMEVYPLSQRLREKIETAQGHFSVMVQRSFELHDSQNTNEEITKAKAEFYKRLGIDEESTYVEEDLD